MEGFVLQNVTRGIITVTINMPLDPNVANMPNHHRRRLIRSSVMNFKVLPGHAIDLVRETGLPKEELMCQVDVNRFVKQGWLADLADARYLDPPKLVEALVELPVEPPVEVPVEVPVKAVEAPVELPVVAPETPEEPVEVPVKVPESPVIPKFEKRKYTKKN